MGSSHLTFLGGTDAVTVSSLLLNCGLFQGLQELRRTNWVSFPVPASSVSTVVLSHAHLDHCGYHHPALPLYDDKDVARALHLIVPVKHGQTVQVGEARIELTVDGTTLVHPGDLGRSTYGNRRHGDTITLADMAAAITRTVERGGSVLIPAFAIDRTEAVLYRLSELRQSGGIPDFPIYVGSPMRLTARDVYLKAIGARSLGRPCVVISSSGMATGGRVLHHLRRFLPDPRMTVLVVGLAAAGTRARDLVGIPYVVPRPGEREDLQRKTPSRAGRTST